MPTAADQKRMVAPPPQLSMRNLRRQKIRNSMDLLRIASGANSIQGFGRLAVGAIIISMVLSLASLLAILYPYFAERTEFVAVYLYPLLAGLIIYLFYLSLKFVREGFIMFEQSKGQEDAALEKFTQEIVE